MSELKPIELPELIEIVNHHSKLMADFFSDITELQKGAILNEKLLDGFTDALVRNYELIKWLFKLIVHLAKNGEIRTLLEASFDKQKKKTLDIVVAFDGDEGGRNAMNRFVIEQLCGDPAKFKIGANLDKRMNALEENLEGLTIHYSSTLKEITKQPIKKKGRYID